MNGYYITITSRIAGYDFNAYVEAETEEQAKLIAIEEIKDMLYKMINSLKVVHIEE